MSQVCLKSASSSLGAVASPSRAQFASFTGLRGTFGARRLAALHRHAGVARAQGIRAATAVDTKFKTLTPLGDRVLVKLKKGEEKSSGGILLPTSAQSKPTSGEVVAVGDGRVAGDKKVPVALQTGVRVLYQKYAGTEVEFNGEEHLILKEDDIIGTMTNDDVKDIKPSTDRVLVKVAEAEEKTAGGVLLTDSAKEKPVIGTVKAVGPGPLDEQGNRKPLDVSEGSTVLYSKYAGTDFKDEDGSQFVVLRAQDIMAVLS